MIMSGAIAAVSPIWLAILPIKGYNLKNIITKSPKSIDNTATCVIRYSKDIMKDRNKKEVQK